MTAIDLLEECQIRGIELTPVGDRIRVTARQPVPEGIRTELVRRKAELLTPGLREYVAVLANWSPDGPHDLPPAPVFPGKPEQPLAWAAWHRAVKTQWRRK